MLSARRVLAACSLAAIIWPLTPRDRANGWWNSMRGGHKRSLRTPNMMLPHRARSQAAMLFFANLGADTISGKIKAVKDQRKQMLEEKKGCGTCAKKCAAAEDALETQSQ